MERDLRLEIGPMYPPDIIELRANGALKRMLGKPLTKEEEDALALGRADKRRAR